MARIKFTDVVAQEVAWPGPDGQPAFMFPAYSRPQLQQLLHAGVMEAHGVAVCTDDPEVREANTALRNVLASALFALVAADVALDGVAQLEVQMGNGHPSPKANPEYWRSRIAELDRRVCRDGAELQKTITELVEANSGLLRAQVIEIITEEFAEGIAKLPKMCPHFHLSLQSGCDATLKRMNRRYTSSEYAEKCELLRKYFPNPALTTDVIVGFPGETEEEFKESYDFVDSIDFYETHIFKYSRREGTKAAVMPDQVDEQIKAKRSAQLIELGEKKRAAYEQSFQGKEVEVLVEENLELNGKEVQTGHTKEYMKIALETNENLKNSIVKVQIGKDSQIIH